MNLYIQGGQQLWRSRAGANQQGAGSDGQKEQRSLQRRFEEGSRGGEGEGSNKSELLWLQGIEVAAEASEPH